MSVPSDLADTPEGQTFAEVVRSAHERGHREFVLLMGVAVRQSLRAKADPCHGEPADTDQQFAGHHLVTDPDLPPRAVRAATAPGAQPLVDAEVDYGDTISPTRPGPHGFEAGDRHA